MRSILTALLLLAGFTCLQAQSFEEYKKQKEAAYNAYKGQKEADFEAYRARVNKEFADYLRRYWEWQEARKGVRSPFDDDKKVTLPDLSNFEIDDEDLVEFTIEPIKIDDSKPITVTPLKYKPISMEKKFQFKFYGAQCEIRFDPSKKYSLGNARENAVADMWMHLSTDAYNNMLYDIQQISKKLQLCDWAYLKLAEAVAELVYGADTNEAAVLSGFIMNQSGYRIRLGRTKEETLHLLVGMDQVIALRSYWVIDGIPYSLTKDKNVGGLFFIDNKFPNEKNMTLSIEKEPIFPRKSTQQRDLRSREYKDMSYSISFNENLLNFYADYPKPVVLNDKGYQTAYYYANMPISKEVKNVLYPELKKAIDGKTKLEAVTVILNYLQTTMVYGYDDELWGRDRPFFPEETLYYLYSDCEDRGILFSRLVRDLVGAETVLLFYPKCEKNGAHIAAAVHFNEEVKGDYVIVNGKKFMICEPTYSNAQPVGKSGFDYSNVSIIMLPK